MRSAEAQQEQRLIRKTHKELVSQLRPILVHAARNGLLGGSSWWSHGRRLYRVGETYWRERNGQTTDVTIAIDSISGRLYRVIQEENGLVVRRLYMVRINPTNLDLLHRTLRSAVLSLSTS